MASKKKAKGKALASSVSAETYNRLLGTKAMLVDVNSALETGKVKVKGAQPATSGATAVILPPSVNKVVLQTRARGSKKWVDDYETDITARIDNFTFAPWNGMACLHDLFNNGYRLADETCDLVNGAPHRRVFYRRSLARIEVQGPVVDGVVSELYVEDDAYMDGDRVITKKPLELLAALSFNEVITHANSYQFSRNGMIIADVRKVRVGDYFLDHMAFRDFENAMSAERHGFTGIIDMRKIVTEDATGNSPYWVESKFLGNRDGQWTSTIVLPSGVALAEVLGFWNPYGPHPMSAGRILNAVDFRRINNMNGVITVGNKIGLANGVEVTLEMHDPSGLGTLQPIDTTWPDALPGVNQVGRRWVQIRSNWRVGSVVENNNQLVHEIISRSEWGVIPVDSSEAARREAAVRNTTRTGIVVHHTYTDVDAPVPGTDARSVTQRVRNIDNGHRNGNGWAGGIGYHFLIGYDGTIFEGRPINWDGAHALNPAPSRNLSHIGIALVGSYYPTGTPPQAQRNALLWLIADVKTRIPTIETVERHHGQCPGPWFDNFHREHFGS